MSRGHTGCVEVYEEERDVSANAPSVPVLVHRKAIRKDKKQLAAKWNLRVCLAIRSTTLKELSLSIEDESSSDRIRLRGASRDADLRMPNFPSVIVVPP